MKKKLVAVAALVLIASAAVVFLVASPNSANKSPGGPFVRQRGGRFFVGNRPFRFVGANVAVMYRDDDRARMPETLRQAAQAGIKVVRIWAFGEGGPNDVKPVADFADWPRHHSFRFAPGQWNEDAFVHLDKVIAEAANNNIYVQLCLTNWWRDTGGVTQYLRWVGIDDAADTKWEALRQMPSQFSDKDSWTWGRRSEVPEDEATRMEMRLDDLRKRFEDQADNYRDLLIELYGEDKGGAFRYAEAFELSQYGRRASVDELKRLFPTFD